MRLLVCLSLLLPCAFLAAGCGKSRKDPLPSASGTHFDSMRGQDPTGQASKRVLNGRSVGDGLVYWGTIRGVPNGNNVSVTLTVYFGPFGGDDNTLQPGQQPYAFPNYINGAEAGRGANDYLPLALAEVPGTGRQLWQVTINTFPTNGSFLAGITRNGNSLLNPNLNTYMAGSQNDSTYYAPTGSLQVFYVPATNSVGLRPAP